MKFWKRVLSNVMLAGGSTIENFKVERGKDDPEVAFVGRIWFNETANELRYTKAGLDGKQIVKRSFADIDEVKKIQSSIITYVDSAIFEAGAVTPETVLSSVDVLRLEVNGTFAENYTRIGVASARIEQLELAGGTLDETFNGIDAELDALNFSLDRNTSAISAMQLSVDTNTALVTSSVEDLTELSADVLLHRTDVDTTVAQLQASILSNSENFNALYASTDTKYANINASINAVKVEFANEVSLNSDRLNSLSITVNGVSTKATSNKAELDVANGKFATLKTAFDAYVAGGVVDPAELSASLNAIAARIDAAVLVTSANKVLISSNKAKTVENAAAIVTLSESIDGKHIVINSRISTLDTLVIKANADILEIRADLNESLANQFSQNTTNTAKFNTINTRLSTKDTEVVGINQRLATTEAVSNVNTTNTSSNTAKGITLENQINAINTVNAGFGVSITENATNLATFKTTNSAALSSMQASILAAELSKNFYTVLLNEVLSTTSYYWKNRTSLAIPIASGKSGLFMLVCTNQFVANDSTRIQSDRGISFRILLNDIPVLNYDCSSNTIDSTLINLVLPEGNNIISLQWASLSNGRNVTINSSEMTMWRLKNV
jgi:hypothetical protein